MQLYIYNSNVKHNSKKQQKYRDCGTVREPFQLRHFYTIYHLIPDKGAATPIPKLYSVKLCVMSKSPVLLEVCLLLQWKSHLTWRILLIYLCTIMRRIL